MNEAILTTKTTVIVFPFDAFGAGGTGRGAELLGDTVREILADNKQETRPTRTDAYRGLVKMREVSFGTTKALGSWRSIGRQMLRQTLKSGERVLWLGGNHLSVLPVYEELGADGSAAGSLVVQFDAHLDVYQLRDINPNPAHGNFLLHSDETLPTIVNIGHRDLFLPPKEVSTYFAAAYTALEVATITDRIRSDIRTRAKKAKRVWIDIDADVFDPAAVPGVNMSLPFGPDPLTLLSLIDACWAGNVVGISISEFDPGRDDRDTGLTLLGWLIEWLLLRWHEGEADEE